MGGGECRSNDYGAATYWDARYSSPSSTGGSGGGRGGEFFDWYQTYPALRPLLRARLPTSSRMLMLGCGNSLLSEDMVKDGYEEVVNIDISSVVIEQMREKHVDIPQLTCNLIFIMDVRDMSFFGDETFDCVLDKGTLDAMMCGNDAPHGASKMLEEVARLLRPDGVYMLITYGAPKERVPLLYQAGCDRKIKLYIMPTPGYQLKRSNGAPLTETIMEEVALTEEGQLPPDYVLKDPESHFIYVCQKSDAANGAPVVADEEIITSK
uniref:Methyltransferase type 11 domain-containing protein n=1 Tax=Leersia perrieri TaxID=77586 RepID=A0A0D9WG55_9ORYZ